MIDVVLQEMTPNFREWLSSLFGLYCPNQKIIYYMDELLTPGNGSQLREDIPYYEALSKIINTNPACLPTANLDIHNFHKENILSL